MDDSAQKSTTQPEGQPASTPAVEPQPVAPAPVAPPVQEPAAAQPAAIPPVPDHKTMQLTPGDHGVHHFSKVVLVGIGAILTIVVALGAGYFLGMGRGAEPVDVETVAIVPSPTPADPTADWKTYTDKDNGYSFKYPADWYVSSDKKLNSSVVVASAPITIPEGTDGPPGPILIGLNQCTNTVTNKKSPCEKTTQERVNVTKTLLTVSSIQSTNFPLDDKVGIQILGTAGEGPLQGTYVKETIFPLNEYQLVASLYGKDNEKIYDQILSTFKFAETVSPTTTASPSAAATATATPMP